MTPPRLLNRDQAREYLGGAAPETFIPPIKVGGRIMWDKKAIDLRFALKHARERCARKLDTRMRVLVWKSLDRKSYGVHWRKLVGYDLLDLQLHLESKFSPRLHWGNFETWHIDHIRPVSSFVITGPRSQGFRGAWALSNLQPLPALENIRKGARWPL